MYDKQARSVLHDLPKLFLLFGFVCSKVLYLNRNVFSNDAVLKQFYKLFIINNFSLMLIINQTIDFESHIYVMLIYFLMEIRWKGRKVAVPLI